MIFEELVLHNFGIYRGRHSIDLRPEPGKPIILIGALNGGGKTTLLDALQLVLYGKLARCSNRGSLAYDTFLKRCINRFAEPEEGTALELQFRHHTESGEEVIRVHRSWRSTGKGVRETLEVLRDGQLDPVYTEHWYEHIDEFIPSRMASLFFFDGEKIEYFAEPENASELLRTGLHSLLGLDLVDQLGKDLDVVSQRRLTDSGNDETARKLQALLDEQTELEEKRSALVTQKAEYLSTVDQLHKSVERLKERYRAEGGELYDQRESIEQAHRAAQDDLQQSERELQDLASGDAPLLLVRDMIRSCEQQTEKEEQASSQSALLEILKERDSSLLSTLAESGVSDEQLKAATQHLEADCEARAEATAVDAYLHVSPSIFQDLSDQYFHDLSNRIGEAVDRHEQCKESVVAQERALRGMPQPETLVSLSDELSEKQTELRAHQLRVDEIKAEIEKLSERVEEVKERRRRFSADQQLQDFAQETSQRIINHTNTVQRTLERYRKALVERHLHQLEHLVLESLQQLLRKEHLIKAVRIDPTSYELTLTDSVGRVLPPDRLSAGERQLLAVSIVWALTKASGKPLPAVIDTPLGRLDGQHRSHLVESYFPFASHQVLLLSTDEEIDNRHYAQLRPLTSQEYQISYDEDARTSLVSYGYPWSEVA